MKIMSIIKKLPLSTILVALILAIGLILFIGSYAKREALSGIFSGRETIIDPQNKDTDNDGLLDWEEELLGTDPLNPDTDADGYLDGEEIASGHNPLVKGPGDKLAFYPLPLGEKYNITEKIFGDIESVFKEYIKQKDEYLTDHPEIDSPEKFLAQTSESTFEQLFKRAILYNEENWLAKAEQILAELPEVFNVEISDNDIKISEDNGDEVKTIYLDKLFAYLNSESFFLKERNFILLKDALFNNELSKLNSIITTNDYEIGKLRETIVPLSLKDVHKRVLKITISLKNVFVSVRGYEIDPIKAIVGLNEVKNVLKEWEILQNELNL